MKKIKRTLIFTLSTVLFGVLLIPGLASAGNHGGGRGGFHGGGHYGGGYSGFHGGGHYGGGYSGFRGGGYYGGGYSGFRGGYRGYYRGGYFGGFYIDPFSWLLSYPFYPYYYPAPVYAYPQPVYVPNQAYAYPDPATTPQVAPAPQGEGKAQGEWVEVPGQMVNNIWVPPHRVWVTDSR